MAQFFSALNVQQYSKLLRTKQLVLTSLKNGQFGLQFTEDKETWIERLKNQEDLEQVEDYRYSILVSFEIEASVINSLIESEATGRFSEKMIAYYEYLKKPLIIPALAADECNVLCLLDVYESEETEDGLSQEWMLLCDSKDNEIWQDFSKAVFKIATLGAIPGAVEAAKELNLSNNE